MEFSTFIGEQQPLELAEAPGHPLPELFQRAVEDLQESKFNALHSKLSHFQRIQPNEEQAASFCWLAICAALCFLERSDSSRALDWLDYAEEILSESHLSVSSPLLGSLSRIARARHSAERALQRVAKTHSRLVEEVDALDDQLERTVNDLYSSLRSPSGHKHQFVENRDKGLKRQANLLRVHMLGDFRVENEDGIEISLCSNRKGQSIFKLMALQPDASLNKDFLINTLWPGEDPEVATGKLHIAISRLRGALENAGLGSETIVLENDGYTLGAKIEIKTDIADFERNLRTGLRARKQGDSDVAKKALNLALDLYEGPFLQDLSHEDWVLLERARLEAQYLKLLVMLASGRFQTGRYAEAAELCEEVLELDELREDVHRMLMRSLYLSGQRAKALQTYRQFKALLRKELGIEPMKKTRSLADKIRNEHPL